MTTQKIPAPVRKLLGQIARGESHRATQATYQQAVDLGLAQYVSGSGWSLTDAGRAQQETK